jgi:light-regulated signal transduction histidine kinase (bacteriophytochrome)
VIVNIRVLKNGRGEITGAINCFVDVTERQRTQAELRSLNEDLKHFAYAASHDLQEPLRMVTSYTQLLAKQYKGTLDPLAEQAIVYAVEGAKQMELLLKGLRDYWEVNEGKAEQDVLTDCNHILEEVLAFLGSSIQQSAAVITHDPLPTVRGAEIPLTLLFKNLVSNALKYTRPGERPRIHISAERSASDWTFSVRDYGIGIEAEYLVKIFAPFKRLHSAEEYPGSGLGLAICQKIIERKRGRIWAESTYGQGSTFYFAIPVKGDKR